MHKMIAYLMYWKEVNEKIWIYKGVGKNIFIYFAERTELFVFSYLSVLLNFAVARPEGSKYKIWLSR